MGFNERSHLQHLHQHTPHQHQQQKQSGWPQKWVLLVLTFLGCVQVCSATGHIEVKFMSYSDNCDEDFGVSKCDPYFQFCLSRPQSGRVSVHRSRCEYAATGGSNGHFHNTNFIDFEFMSSILGHANPWEVKVAAFYDPEIMLAMEVMDKDKWTRNDHLNTFGVKLKEKVWPNVDDAKWVDRSMSNRGHTLRFRIRLYCDQYYYTSACDVHCRPQDNESGHYTCEDGTGRKICMQGWQGSNCDRDVNECDDSEVCNSGSCTNLPGSFKCDCPDGYEGQTCEKHVDPCLSQPCQNGGDCYGHGSRQDYVCVCRSGWEGKSCSDKRDPCKDPLCNNGGLCVSNEAKTSYHCECRYPFSGSHCDDLFTTTTTTPSTTTTSTSTTTTTPSTTTTSTTTATTTTSPSTTTTSPSTTTTSTTTVPTTTAIRTTPTTQKIATTPQEQPETSSATTTTVPPNDRRNGIVSGLGAADASRHRTSKEDLDLPPWLVGLTAGLALLILLAVLIFFVVRRRNKKMMLSRNSSVTYSRDGLAFTNQAFPAHEVEAGVVVPANVRVSDGLRELPPVPVTTADQVETQGRSDVRDEDQGAIGGCSTVSTTVPPCKEKDPELTNKLSETLLRYKEGRAEPNEYADIRTLSMRFEERPKEELSATDKDHVDQTNSHDSDDGSTDISIMTDTEEPHYSTLDEIGDAVVQNVAATLSDASTGDVDYAVPRSSTPTVSETTEYSQPRHHPPTMSERAEYLQPIEPPTNSDKAEYAHPKNTCSTPESDVYSVPRNPSTTSDERQLSASTGAATNPMYLSLPAASECTIDDVIAPPRLHH